jgi:signal transduction histidine kinase
MTDHRSSTASQKVTDRSLAVCLFAVMIVIFTGCGKVSGAENLSRCADIRALTREQAAEGRPVLLRGVITSGQKRRGAFVLQDDSEGIYVTPGQVDPALQREIEWIDVESLEAGSVLEVEGITAPGGFAPLVVAQRVRFLGKGELPAARAATLTDMRTGTFDCQRAELQGVVQRWHWEERTSELWLQVAEQAGGFSVTVPDAAGLDAARLVDAAVRAKGACFSFFNTRGEIVGVRLRLAGGDDLEIIEPPPSDPFAAPEVPALALRPFRRGPPILHRQRLAGVVTLARAGQLVYVQTKERGFRVNTRSGDVFTPGDVVEATGFVAPTNHFAVMNDALLRKTGRTAAPAPTAVSSAGILATKVNPGRLLRVEDYDGALVALRGRLVRVETLAGQEPRLYLDCAGSLISAVLGTQTTAASLAQLQPESEIEATGICVVQLDQEWPASVIPAPANFSLLLQGADSLRVVRAPSWWTRERVLRLLAGVAALATLAGAWAIALRRRVIAQTEIIRQKIERESVLGERERIARELHDTLEQELMGVNMLLDETTVHLPRDPSRAAQTLSLAHRMLRHCRGESRSSIRDLRSMTLENRGLPAALDELLRPVATMNGAEFTVATEGEARKLRFAPGEPVGASNPRSIGVKAVKPKR